MSDVLSNNRVNELENAEKGIFYSIQAHILSGYCTDRQLILPLDRELKFCLMTTINGEPKITDQRRNLKCLREEPIMKQEVIAKTQVSSYSQKMNSQSNFNRLVSDIFTNSTFRPIFKIGESDYVYDKLRKCNNVFYPEEGKTVRELLEQSYAYLTKNYRNEYIYKNTIANKILLGRHNLNTTTLLSEFTIGNSIADMLLLNGTSTVYEIKTELDCPDKLIKQIEDYKKAFAKIFLVTHHTLLEKYRSLTEGMSVGLISLSNRFNLSLVKEAIEDYTQLDNVVMMKCLRKDEYTSIVREYYGTTPLVSNIKYFSTCLELCKQIDSVIFHSLVLEVLKKRIHKGKEFLMSGQIPTELKHICLCANPSQKGYSNLFNFLNKIL